MFYKSNPAFSYGQNECIDFICLFLKNNFCLLINLALAAKKIRKKIHHLKHKQVIGYNLSSSFVFFLFYSLVLFSNRARWLYCGTNTKIESLWNQVFSPYLHNNILRDALLLLECVKISFFVVSSGKFFYSQLVPVICFYSRSFFSRPFPSAVYF